MKYTNIGELKLLNGDTPTSNDWKTWVLEEDMVLRNHTVPAGFMTDFASIPWFARWMFRSTGAPYQRAAVMHDWLYSSFYRINRREADWQMFWQARQDGTSEVRATLILMALRLGAGPAWRKNRRRLRINPRWRYLDQDEPSSPLWTGHSG